MSVQWIPSNGTEGYQFTIDWCSRCARDAVCNGQKTFDDCDDSELSALVTTSHAATMRAMDAAAKAFEEALK